ncbi:uncharacterized protein LOC143468517 [Clavelina lepadiformis]|uniref:uncharacterized protein LOC143468517 n=1 Tax=Clavelina lepadiformis TaxID=159417 RepID=UPI0040423150
MQLVAFLILNLLHIPVLNAFTFGVELLGCYRIVDVRRQTITNAEGSSHWLGIEADNRDLKVIVCAAVAYERGMKIFAIQNQTCMVTLDGEIDHQKYEVRSCEARRWKLRIYRLISPVFVENLGCWADGRSRVDSAIPSLEGGSDFLDGRPGRRSDALLKCAFAAVEKGSTIFALQNGGRCHASMNANVTYAQYGETPQRCKSDGKGGKRANQVYKIVNHDLSLAGTKRLGCWADLAEPAIPNLDLDDDVIGDAKYRCYVTSLRRGFHVFALQNGGRCFASDRANETYFKYGPSDDCDEDGGGGVRANEVYEAGRMVFVKNLGCWRDIPNHTIPLVDEFPTYRSRRNPLYGCLNFAAQMGHSVFALQEGGLCATSENAEDVYKMHGTSEGCGPDGKGGALANQVYKIEGALD